MALKLAIHRNHLPSCPDPYVIRSSTGDKMEYEELVDHMAAGRTTLTKTDILAALQLYKEELERQLAEGKTVHTPTGAFSVFASGTMLSLDEAFIPGEGENNHSLRIHHRTDSGFEKAVTRALRIDRDERPDFGTPNIQAVRAAGETDPAAIRSGGMIEVKGLRLRFDPADQRQGLFFVAADGSETRSPFYPLMQPSTLLASVPDGLGAGSYALVLRAAVNGKDVKERRFESVSLVGSP